MFSYELHNRFADQGILSIAIHPGNLKLDTERHTSFGARLVSLVVCSCVIDHNTVTSLVDWLQNPILGTSEKGALTQLWAGTMSEAVEFGGKVRSGGNYFLQGHVY